MVYLPTRLVQALPKLLLALACLATSAFCALRVVPTAQQLVTQWVSYPPTETLLTLAVTVAILAVGAIITSWWSLGFALTYLAMITVPSSQLHRILAAGALRVAPRIARAALVSVTGVSLSLTATGALATPAPSSSPQLAMPVDSTFPNNFAGPGDAGVPSTYLGFGAPSDATGPTAYLGFGVPTTNTSPAQAPQPAPPQAAPAPAPSAPSISSAPAVPTPSAATPAASTAVTVADGDSLWSITASLVPSADSSDVAALWPQLYQANSDQIGANPDMILPGTVLTVPAEFEAPATS